MIPKDRLWHQTRHVILKTIKRCKQLQKSANRMLTCLKMECLSIIVAVMQSKINLESFQMSMGRVLQQTRNFPLLCLKPQRLSLPVNAISIRASNATATTKLFNIVLKDLMLTSTLVWPPIRSLHNDTQGTAKQDLGRALTMIQSEKGLLQMNHYQVLTLILRTKREGTIKKYDIWRCSQD